MSLLDVDPGGGVLTKLCDCCGTVDAVPLSGLKLGMGSGSRINPDAMQMPACPGCGAVEVMLRTWDVTPEGWRGDGHCEQRAAKNALAKHLKARGQQHVPAKPLHDAETGDPPEIMVLAHARDLLVPGSDRVPEHGRRNVEIARSRGQGTKSRPAITFGPRTR